MSSDSQMATAYVPQIQYARWKDRADELDMSVSEFIKGIVEALEGDKVEVQNDVYYPIDDSPEVRS